MPTRNRGPEASRTTLYPFVRLDDGRARSWLTEQWEISSRDELLRRLAHLADTGYRARASARTSTSPIAWDVGLYVDVVRKGFAAGHLDEAATWPLLHQIVPLARDTYRSSRGFAEGYLTGRAIWMGLLRDSPDEHFPASQQISDAHLRSLLDPARAESPWNRAPSEAIAHYADRAR